ncbi:MAG: acylphosphatase [bacterium]
MEKSLRVIIKGYVQGVGFRYWAYRHATSLGIKGYVRNRPDGSVEVLASGDQETVDHFLSLLRRGPSSALVEELEIDEVPGMVKEDVFRIKYD